jgi:hypothetical protein
VRVRGALATLALEQGDLEQAHEEFSRVRDEAGADLRSAALAVGMIGHVEQELGHLDQAASAYEHAATAFAALPDPRLAAVYRGYRATVAHERGEPDADARYGAAIDEVAPHGHHFAGLFAACQGALRASQSDARAAESFSRADRELADCDDVAIRHAARIHRSWLDGDEALEPLAAGPTSDDVRFALRLVRARRAAADAMLTVGDGWVRFAGETIDLSRRKILWQLLMALVDGREQHPGRAVRRERLIEAAWGEERMLASAAAHRLRVAIHELRRKGLSAAIDSAPEGYRLACPVERSDAI